MPQKYNLSIGLRIMQFLLSRQPHWADVSLKRARSMESDWLSRGFNRRIDMHHVEDTSIDGPHGDIPLRIYRPTAATDLTCIVFYHGGGWTVGNLGMYDHICRRVARDCEAVVISVDYHLAPEYPYPVATEDAHTALLWASDHAGDYGANPERLVVMGDSAGGNLSAVMTLMSRDKGGPPIAGQVLIYPAVDAHNEYPSRIELDDAPVLDRKAMDFFILQYAPDEAIRAEPYLSPLLADDHSGLPPALVQLAEYDPLRDEGMAYAEKLRASGVDVREVCYPRMVHGFYSVGAFAPARTNAAYADIAQFVTTLRTPVG